MSRIGRIRKFLYQHMLLPFSVVLFFLFQACGTMKTVSVENAEEEKTVSSIEENSEGKKEIKEEGKQESVPDTPTVSEFIVGAGDTIEIDVYSHDDLKRTVRIDPSGKIMYPLAGDIHAAGLSIFQLRDSIREKLSKYIVDPDVSIGVVSIENQKIIILGEVRNPGFFQIETSLTILEAISKAGGMTIDGKTNSVLLIRGGMKKPELMTLNLVDVFKKGDFSQNVALQRGDIIYVPRTFIANVDRFFTHLSTILSPLLTLETGYFIGQQIEQRSSRSTVTAR